MWNMTYVKFDIILCKIYFFADINRKFLLFAQYEFNLFNFSLLGSDRTPDGARVEKENNPKTKWQLLSYFDYS